MKLVHFVLFLIFWAFHFSFAEGQKDQKVQGGEGKKAVLEVSKTNGFRLSKVAIQTIGLRFQQIETTKNLSAPKEALVQSLGTLGIYRLREGWFKWIPVQTGSLLDSKIKITTGEIKGGDEIVVGGVALLRVSEMEAFNGSSDGGLADGGLADGGLE